MLLIQRLPVMRGFLHIPVQHVLRHAFVVVTLFFDTGTIVVRGYLVLRMRQRRYAKKREGCDTDSLL